jgi:farnesyl diphosphate synthase
MVVRMNNISPYARSLAFDASAHFPSLKAALASTARDVEDALDELLPRPAGRHARVQEAMRYAVLNGGKRLRPFIAKQCAELFGSQRIPTIRVAAAIEIAHSYSLVHDDLPAMDNDDLRRGQPTTHRRFDEATAILAGDGLLTLAFEILADPRTHPSGNIRALLVRRFAEALGSEGMVGGQMIDIDAPCQQLGTGEIIDMQHRKTGALFEFSCDAGAMITGREQSDLVRLKNYASAFGLAFQIADDLIDVLGSANAAGKRVGKDQGAGKATLVATWGVAAAKAKVSDLAQSASAALAAYGPRADLLRALPFYLLERSA